MPSLMNAPIGDENCHVTMRFLWRCLNLKLRDRYFFNGAGRKPFEAVV